MNIPFSNEDYTKECWRRDINDVDILCFHPVPTYKVRWVHVPTKCFAQLTDRKIACSGRGANTLSRYTTKVHRR